MHLPTLFTVADTFAIRGRGTVLVGPRLFEVRGVIAVGDQVELRLPDGRTVRSRIAAIECFTGPPTDNPGVGVALVDVVDVPEGTTVHSSGRPRRVID
jgi:hypothetical protein